MSKSKLKSIQSSVQQLNKRTLGSTKKMNCGLLYNTPEARRKAHAAFGRVPMKPEMGLGSDDLHDEKLTIQDHIDNIRTKIVLKDRHIQILKEVNDKKQIGTHDVIRDLHDENEMLRHRLMLALNAEKIAVQNATRTHRDFQLALTDKCSEEAKEWILERIFRSSQRLNLLLYELAVKRNNLEEAEFMVHILEIERNPESYKRLSNPNTVWTKGLEFEIDRAKVKREAVSVLMVKYKWIADYLERESLQHPPIIKSYTIQLQTLEAEISGLESMLKTASAFRDDALIDLAKCENEAQENRKVRRRELRKMRDRVRKELDEAHQMSLRHQRSQVNSPNRNRQYEYQLAKSKYLEHEQTHKEKQRIIDLFEIRAKRLVETMKVKDLTHIPQVLKESHDLQIKLEKDACTKEKERNFLIKQRDQLFLILCHFKYNGLEDHEKFLQRKIILEKAIKDTENDIHECTKRLNEYGEIIVSMKFGVLNLLEMTDRKKSSRPPVREKNLLKALKKVYDRVKKIVDHVNLLKELLQDRPEPTRDYEKLVNEISPTIIPGRLIRVKTALEQEELEDLRMMSENEEAHGDIKILTREERKKQSQKIIHQAILSGKTKKNQFVNPYLQNRKNKHN